MSERPISTYRDALSRITDAAFGKRGASFASIPARPEHDADALLADALDELERLRRERDTPIPAEETIAGLKAEIERLRAITAEQVETKVRETIEQLMSLTITVPEGTVLPQPEIAGPLQVLEEPLVLRLAKAETERDALRAACEVAESVLTLEDPSHYDDHEAGSRYEDCGACRTEPALGTLRAALAEVKP